MQISPQSPETAFTLLEMSIVLAIIAVVMGSGLAIFAAALDKRQLQETNIKLAALQNAFLNYRITYNRLPCPADITLTYASNYFGTEGSNPATCIAGAVYNGSTGVRTIANVTPVANFYSSGLRYAVIGMVPTKTLHLPDDYAIDGWGRRILYAVDNRLTGSNAFTTYPITTTTTPFLTVNASKAGPTRTAVALYVLVSFGANGHGAWPQNVSSTAARITAGSVNIDEQTNCHCDSTATASAFSKVFVQKTPTQNASNILDSFDDIVVYATRADLRTPTE
jgi:prepilin-type N-terminal cleavage/methylation domain-containing protein